ncbi:MAG: hypothetical protein NT150_12430 [Bacteroidetes bacterium]|nr:hypothetical protein [Bacteroidota bacterium]
MNKLLLGLVFLMVSTLSYAQETSSNCYEKYAKKFTERGAFIVEDGWHEDIVITIRKGTTAECIPGKVRVEKGVIVAMYRRFSDGTYEETPMTKTYKHKEEMTIAAGSGISKSMLTTEDEIINVVFTKHIKPPKKKFAAATDPDDL